MRSVMKVVSKMRLFVKRKRAERQKQQKMLAEIVVRKAKARNDRVSHQTKMLQRYIGTSREKGVANEAGKTIYQ